MATLRETVRAVMEPYAVEGANYDSFLTISPDENVYTVVDIARDSRSRHFTATSLIVRIVDKQIIIEHDDNDKPLVDALIQAGIPQEQIILAYNEETPI